LEVGSVVAQPSLSLGATSCCSAAVIFHGTAFNVVDY
jgi:hypothetical protein